MDALQTNQPSQVISHATAPSFVAVVIGRMNGVIDRIRTLNAIADDDTARAHLKADLPRLQRRARLLNRATFLAVASALCTTVLVVLAFVSAFIGRRHEPAAAVMFVLALALMGGALFTLACEVRIALTEYDHFA
jgi:hypothetical protein